jgi:simple sugar transport system ATP-binding protein
MNILYGLLTKDSGTVKVRGEVVDFKSPRDAILRGIGMVHQHFKLIPTFTVTENVMLGAEPMLIDASVDIPIKGFTVNPSFNPVLPMDFKSAQEEIRRIAEENGMKIDPNTKVQDLSVGLQQRVEIIKLLYRKADILILDEPTAVLTPQEVNELFETLETFRKAGKTIILITHKLREPMALADRISVLRDGELVGTVKKADTSVEALAEMMVGRPVVFRVAKTKAAPAQTVLSIQDVHINDDRGLPAVKGISLDIRSGEILGLAGVEGNGQTELVEGIMGLRKIRKGEVLIEDIKITRKSPRKIREAGVGYIPQDRQRRGLILPFTIKENLVLGGHYTGDFVLDLPKRVPRQILNWGAIESYSAKLVKNYGIKIKRLDDPVSTLSGGNQQKVVVARILGFNPKVVIASQPTRGLDVGATEYIHNVLIRMRDEGAAVFLVSADLDEIRSLSDRIAVIFDGEIVAIKDPDETDEQELGLLMAGHEEEPLSKEVET